MYLRRRSLLILLFQQLCAWHCRSRNGSWYTQMVADGWPQRVHPPQYPASSRQQVYGHALVLQVLSGQGLLKDGASQQRSSKQVFGMQGKLSSPRSRAAVGVFITWWYTSVARSLCNSQQWQTRCYGGVNVKYQRYYSWLIDCGCWSNWTRNASQDNSIPPSKAEPQAWPGKDEEHKVLALSMQHNFACHSYIHTKRSKSTMVTCQATTYTHTAQAPSQMITWYKKSQRQDMSEVARAERSVCTQLAHIYMSWNAWPWLFYMLESWMLCGGVQRATLGCNSGLVLSAHNLTCYTI